MPTEEVLFRDGLGDRVLVRDPQGHPLHDCLQIRPELCALPAFEFALNERLGLVKTFQHPSFAAAREIIRIPGRQPQLGLISDPSDGTRLAEVLSRAESGARPITRGAVMHVIREVLNGLAELHKLSGNMAHGVLGPERIVIAGAGVRVADYVLGSAVEQLRLSPQRYWRELRVAVPPSAGAVRLDRRVDVAQVGMTALAMLAGRPLRESEDISSIGELLSSLSLPSPLRSWLLKALHMDPRRLFLSAADALRALDDAAAESRLQPAPQELDQCDPRSRVAQFRSPFPVAAPNTVRPPAAAIPQSSSPESPVATAWRRDAAARRPRAPRVARSDRQRRTIERFQRIAWIGLIVTLMTAAFIAAQFVPAPAWLTPSTGAIVIESNPPGVPVLIDGEEKGVTPLTVNVAGGRHQVELRGPGRARVFNVFVSRGTRVAQYVEFTPERRR